MEGPPSRIERAASRGQLLHYELWRTPGKLGAPIPFNGQASIQGYAARPFPPTQPLDCSRRMAYLRSKEAERSSYGRLGAKNARSALPSAARRRTGLQIDVPRLDWNGSVSACAEELTLLSPASTVFSVLRDAKSNGRVDVRLLGKRAARAALR
jgi:hypothetical protein